jgi:hypothetical protein
MMTELLLKRAGEVAQDAEPRRDQFAARGTVARLRT